MPLAVLQEHCAASSRSVLSGVSVESKGQDVAVPAFPSPSFHAGALAAGGAQLGCSPAPGLVLVSSMKEAQNASLGMHLSHQAGEGSLCSQLALLGSVSEQVGESVEEVLWAQIHRLRRQPSSQTTCSLGVVRCCEEVNKEVGVVVMLGAVSQVVLCEKGSDTHAEGHETTERDYADVAAASARGPRWARRSILAGCMAEWRSPASGSGPTKRRRANSPTWPTTVCWSSRGHGRLRARPSRGDSSRRGVALSDLARNS